MKGRHFAKLLRLTDARSLLRNASSFFHALRQAGNNVRDPGNVSHVGPIRIYYICADRFNRSAPSVPFPTAEVDLLDLKNSYGFPHQWSTCDGHAVTRVPGFIMYIALCPCTTCVVHSRLHAMICRVCMIYSSTYFAIQ